MSTTFAARASRQSAVLATIAGLHVGAIMLVATGLRFTSDLDANDYRPIFALPPDPVPTTESRPDLVAADEYVSGPVEAPDVNFGVENELQQVTAGLPAIGAGDAGAGPAVTVPVYQGPALRTGNSRLAALINSCYPAASRRLGQEGRGVARILVEAAGRTSNWSVEQGTGFPVLDAAMGCVAQRLQFEPARSDGRAIAATVSMPIVFRLH